MVGDRLLWDLRRLRDVAVPEGVQKIGEHWFKNSAIESVEIPTSVTVLGDEAFSGCENLKRVTFANDSRLEEIGRMCFYGNAFEEITLLKTLKRIGEDALSECKSLKKVCVEDGCEACLAAAQIPDSAAVRLLQETVTGSVRALDPRSRARAVIPEGTEKIANRWFWGSGIESVTIPASVREIGIDVFLECRNLRTVTFALERRLERIGPECFCDAGMERVVVPRSVAEIQERAFVSCKNLAEVVFEEGSRLKVIDESVFGYCTNLEKVNLPKGLKSIERSAFYCCKSLKSIRLPEGLEKIGVDCFSFSGLEEVTLPASVRKVDHGAFRGCKQLKSAHLNEGLATLGGEVFA